MHLKDLFVLSAKNVFRAGSRTTLCILAICIGIASVTIVIALGNAAGVSVQAEMERIGIRGIVFYPKNGDDVSSDVMQVIAQTDGVTAAMPLAVRTGSVHFRNITSSSGILGIDHTLADVFHLEVLYGALPQAQQIRRGEKIAVIDTELAQKAYKRDNVTGKSISVTVDGVTETFTICAVIRSQSAGISALLNNQLPHLVYVPNVVLREMSSAAKADKVVVAVNTDEQDALAQGLLEQISKNTGAVYRFENLNRYLYSFTLITDAVTLLISGIAAISVVVGGIGVMNAMISSVEVRIREIGIYRALGAKKRDIVKNFVLEAILLCLIGGSFGVAFSWGVFQLLQNVTTITIAFHWKTALVGLGMSTLCGIVFGLMPAIRAAKLDPIQAIRSE